MEEIKVEEIVHYDKSILGKMITTIQDAQKALAHNVNIKAFKQENDKYIILINNIAIQCDNEKQAVSTIQQLLLNIEQKYQEGKTPEITAGENNEEVKLDVNREGVSKLIEAQSVSAQDILISGEPLEELEVVAEKLLKRATVSIEYNHEPTEAIDFNLPGKDIIKIVRDADYQYSYRVVEFNNNR